MKSLNPDLVIFDLDGTLLDSLPGTFRSFADAVEPAIGRRPSMEEMRSRFGPPDHRIVREWVGEAEAEAALTRLHASYDREFAGLEPVPGVVPLIAALRNAGKRVALFTGRGRKSTNLLLRTTGLEGLFDCTVTGDEVPASKPAPDGLLRIVEMAGDPAAVPVYVGDSAMDARAAAAAGMDCVIVRWAQERESGSMGDVAEADSVDALGDLLGVNPRG